MFSMLFSLISAGVVFAQGNQKKEELLEKLCIKVQERVTERLRKYEDNIQVHTTNYKKISSKITEIADKLDDKGYDVAEVRANVEEFDKMVEEYNNSYGEFIKSLNYTEELTCDGPEAQFKGVLKEAREQLKKTIEKRQEIRSYYAHTLRQSLIDLRNQDVEEDND